MKKKVIIGSLILIVILAFVTVNILKSTGSLPAFGGGNAIGIKVKKVEKGSISATVSSSGVVEEVSKTEIYFDTPMKVQSVPVVKNQKVSKGQKLVELDMDALNSELAQLKITKATTELALQKTMTQDSIKSVTGLEAALSMAGNSYESAQRVLENSRKDLEDNLALSKIGAISSSELEKYKKAVADAEIALRNAEASVQTAADNLDEAKKNNSQTVSGKVIDVEIQRKNLEATNLKIADLENKIKKIMDCTVSPTSGVITSKNVEEGGYTSSAQPAFVIVNPDNLQIKADVKEFDIKHVALGQAVKITGDAVSKEMVITGRVSAIAPVAKKNKTASGEETMVEVAIAIDKPNPILKPGLSVTCDIITSERNNALLVSFEMIREDKDGNKQVLVFSEKEGILHVKPVKLGISSDLTIEVLDGINEGDLVVLNPLPSYKDGTKAKITSDTKK